jgi:hypothetical protein
MDGQTLLKEGTLSSVVEALSDLSRAPRKSDCPRLTSQTPALFNYLKRFWLVDGSLPNSEGKSNADKAGINQVGT